MNPLPSGLPIQHFAAPIAAEQPQEAAGSQVLYPHANQLSLARMSRNTLAVLEQSNGQYNYLAMRAIGLISDCPLDLHSAQGADAWYSSPAGDLAVCARLNEQSQYDVISISSPTEMFFLTDPSPAAWHDSASSVTDSEQLPVSSHSDAQHSRGQLTQVMIRQNNSQDLLGWPLPSGVSVGTQSTGFSDDGSASTAAAIPGPRRTRTAHAPRPRPYPASSRSEAPSKGTRQRRSAATNEQIRAELKNDDGTWRTKRAVASSLHTAGVGVSNNRILAQLQAAGGVRRLPSATNDQIRAQLENDDGTWRNRSDVTSALHAAGLGADNYRIQTQLRAAGRARYLPSATDEQIRAHLKNDDGTWRAQEAVASSLHTAGLGAGYNRIQNQLRTVRGGRKLPSATDNQIRAHLKNDDGTWRTQQAVASALHAVGLGAANIRIQTQLQAAGGGRKLPSATNDQIRAELKNDDGTLRTHGAVVSALHAVGLGAANNRILAQLQAAGGARRLRGATDDQSGRS
ncbi:hypothetical protein [Pseudomonas sp. GL-B-16]|uniref:hypothetical protein n=1 Tax=Pseudomonas sp. GL-B-16 TaxID=2832373 RepID=UPI001CBCA508|nr:hypothetical protein [Pseudomonas sp. GL-B-16]